MKALYLWILDVFLIIISISFIQILIPDGKMKKYASFIFSIIILTIIVLPIGNFIIDLVGQ